MRKRRKIDDTQRLDWLDRLSSSRWYFCQMGCCLKQTASDSKRGLDIRAAIDAAIRAARKESGKRG